jgi:hypothetical protein
VVLVPFELTLSFLEVNLGKQQEISQIAASGPGFRLGYLLNMFGILSAVYRLGALTLFVCPLDVVQVRASTETETLTRGFVILETLVETLHTPWRYWDNIAVCS